MAEPIEAAYRLKAAKTNMPIKAAKPNAMRARKNLAMLGNAGLAF
jgi:hypothetical protein